MDFGQEGHEGYSESGVRRLNRLVATLDGHTHIYQYPPEESDRAVRMIKLHVEEGQLHPYAGLVLVGMIRRSSDV